MFQGNGDVALYNALSKELSGLLIRIYQLDPTNYSTNEAHVKSEFEKLSQASLDAGARLIAMRQALLRLTTTVEDLETQAKEFTNVKPVHVINEEPTMEDLVAQIRSQ